MSQQSTFWRVCDKFDVCHCDWRYTIHDCEEEGVAKVIYWIVAVVCGIFIFVTAALLYFRLIHKKQKIIELKNGFPRPRPLESLIFCGFIFCILQTIHATFILTQTFTNPIFRAFIYDFGLQFGYHAFACYFFGVSYTLSVSNRVVYNTWSKYQTWIDILCSAAIVLPIFTATPWGVAAGVYASRGNNELAARYTMIQHYVWTFYTVFIGALLLFAGVRLVRLFDKYIASHNRLGNGDNKYQVGIIKVKTIVVVGTSCMWIFALLLCLYGSFREAIMSTMISNMVIAAVWSFAGPITCFFIAISLIIKPEIFDQLRALTSDSDISSGSRTHNTSKKQGSFETGYRMTDHTRANPFVPSSVSISIDETTRISFQDSKSNIESVDLTAFGSEQHLTQVEEEQLAYNAVISRVRTPTPVHNSPGYI